MLIHQDGQDFLLLVYLVLLSLYYVKFGNSISLILLGLSIINSMLKLILISPIGLFGICCSAALYTAISISLISCLMGILSHVWVGLICMLLHSLYLTIAQQYIYINSVQHSVLNNSQSPTRNSANPEYLHPLNIENKIQQTTKPNCNICSLCDRSMDNMSNWSNK